MAAEWWPALTAAFAQAILSASGSLLVGWLLFLTLQSWPPGRARTFFEFGLLLPNMVPPLFVALGLLNLVTVFVSFPYGVGAVIAAHVLLNSGLVAIALDRLVHARLGGMAEVCWIMGAKPALFWRKVAWPYLRADLACLYLFVFSLCFTSFSLPLLLSGDRASTLELVIYDTIRIDGRWDKAVLLAAFQASVLLAMAWLLPQPFWPPRPARQNLDYLSWRPGRWLVLLPAAILFLGWVAGACAGLSAHWDPGFVATLWGAGLTTFIIALAVGLLHLLIFLLIAYVSPHARLRRFLNGYLSPSPVITGFALLLVPGEGEVWSILKTILALTLISLPLLYRWIVHSAIVGVSGQVNMARTLGASWSAILFDIVWPQVSSPLMRACGLAALWASGDFALTGILAGNVSTLPLVMEGLIGNYRMEMAQVLMIPLVAIGLGTYYLFVRAEKYVSR
jgi:thiamine transport system permease protein